MRKRYLYDGSGGLLYAQEGDSVILDRRELSIEAGYYVMPDIQPYKSMIDGHMVNSRSDHRRHLKVNGCIEVGNDSGLTKRPQPMKSPPGLKDEILKAARKHWKDI